MLAASSAPQCLSRLLPLLPPPPTTLRLSSTPHSAPHPGGCRTSTQELNLVQTFSMPLRWGESARCDVGREEPCVTTTHMLAHDREVAVSEPCVPSSSASCCSNSLGTERLLVSTRVISHSAFQHKGMLTKQQIFGKPCYSLTFFTSIFASHILY